MGQRWKSHADSIFGIMTSVSLTERLMKFPRFKFEMQQEKHLKFQTSLIVNLDPQFKLVPHLNDTLI